MPQFLGEERAATIIYDYNNYLVPRVSYNTRRYYVMKVKRFLSLFPPTTEHLNAYLQRTRARYDTKAAFKHLFRMLGVLALYDELIPVKDPPRAIKGVYTSRDNIKKLISKIDNPSHRLIAKMQFDSGRRVSEIISLERKNIEPADDGTVICQIYQPKTKGGKAVYFYVSEETGKALQAYLVKQTKKHPFILSKSKNFQTAIDTNRIYFWRSLVEAAKNTNIPRFRSHDFRRNFAQDMHKHLLQKFKEGKIQGEPMHVLRELMGHSKTSTTELYIKEISEDMRKLIREVRG